MNRQDIKLNEAEEAVLVALLGGALDTDAIMLETGIRRLQVMRIMIKLEQLGLVEEQVN